MVLVALRKAEDPELLSFSIAGSVMGMMSWWKNHNYDIPTDKFKRQVKTMVRALSESVMTDVEE